MLEIIREFILEHQLFSPGETVLVGFSGGADSLCLLSVLQKLKEDLEIHVTACHVHHMIRDNADRDAAFSKEFCEKSDIPFILKKVDVPAYMKENHLSLEEAARILRLKALKEAAEACGAQKIALAHHADDQAETVLFQMIRGSALRGLSGMQPQRDEFIRPLLCVTKEEILSYLSEMKLSYVEDETNALFDASRNVIRHQVIPALQEVREDAAEKIAATASYVSRADDFIRGEAAAWIRENMSEGEIPAETFRELHPVLKEYIVTEMLRTKGISLKDIGRKHIDGIVYLASKEVGKTAVLPGGSYGIRTYSGITLKTPGEMPGSARESAENGLFTAEKEEDGKLSVRVFPAEKGTKFPEKEYTKWFSYDKIEEPVVLRHREPGDVFSTTPGTHKKLKDVLIDEKIPKEERDRLFVVAAGKDVLWIVGRRMNESYKIDEDTKEIMEIEIIRGEKS